MNTMRMWAGCSALLLLAAAGVRAQEKPKTPADTKPITPLRIQVLFSEYEGEKKVNSLPYTVSVNADEPPGRERTSLRMGIRIPITVQAPPGKDTTQYMDVGTDIDGGAMSTEDGHFKLNLTVRRSTVYASGPEKKSLDWTPGDQPLSAQPILRQFSASFNLLLRDGQTVQTTMATDPVSGRVVKVDVTLNIVK